MSVDLDTWRSQLLEQRAGQTGLNWYQCNLCGKRIVTIDVDPGVTPMFIGCRATPDCPGTAQSGMYPPAEPPAPVVWVLAWEWRIPTEADLAGHGAQTEAIRAYTDNGGLSLQPWTGRPSAYNPDFPDDATRQRATERHGATA